MTQKTVQIPSISCGHCVATIQRELGELAGVRRVDGDPKTKTVTIQFEPPATWDAVQQTLTEIGFPAELP
jgi:copper chaperone